MKISGVPLSIRSTDTTSLLDEPITEFHKLSFRLLAKLQNNAAACFDKMIRNLSTLCNIHHYVSDSVCILQANALNRMKYKIQTMHDISSKTYSNSVELPIHGV